MDGVSSRDHILEFLFACTQLMIHVSRICEDIILYSSQEFGILKLPDSLTTGSSIMPQKKILILQNSFVENREG
ncbi:lyase domain protein [Leptospira interrogans serovar Grippotyphosa str. LT2186]|uniref:argininosuccinate lyase n=1 Tax=Leptospira interrogans serovar Grippotyphosa str. LT2186 TaxID=1001599 RepID=M3I6G9_LEPIR|nr:lyase domain protein [Leptospira interrogans serovar Grippotyphosa str. LT2186]